MRKICKGDEVVVIAGKEKGKHGAVLRVLDDKLVVEGLNVVKKHQKPNPVRGIQGGIVEIAAPLHVSNVAIFNPVTQKADRVGFKLLDDGRKVRVFRSNGEIVSS